MDYGYSGCGSALRFYLLRPESASGYTGFHVHVQVHVHYLT